jgi:hypothetical protein
VFCLFLSGEDDVAEISIVSKFVKKSIPHPPALAAPRSSRRRFCPHFPRRDPRTLRNRSPSEKTSQDAVQSVWAVSILVPATCPATALRSLPGSPFRLKAPHPNVENWRQRVLKKQVSPSLSGVPAPVGRCDFSPLGASFTRCIGSSGGPPRSTQVESITSITTEIRPSINAEAVRAVPRPSDDMRDESREVTRSSADDLARTHPSIHVTQTELR